MVIRIGGIAHRDLPAESVEPLLIRTLGVFRHRLRHTRHWRQHGCARRLWRPVGRTWHRTNRSDIYREHVGLLFLFTTAEADGGEAAQQADLALFRIVAARLLAALGAQLGLSRTRELVDIRHAPRPLGRAFWGRWNESARDRRGF